MKYIGYHKSGTLPIKNGDTVTIPKGTPFKSTNPSKREGVTGRKMTVKVNHLMPGSSMEEYEYQVEVSRGLFKEGATPQILFGREFRALTNPAVVWVGSGGYWVEVDINLVEGI